MSTTLAPDALVTEKQFMRLVLDCARLHGWLGYHTHDSRRSARGFPDLVLTRGGRLVVAELKRRDGRLTPVQEQWLIALRRVPGVEVAVWRPEDWPAVVAALS